MTLILFGLVFAFVVYISPRPGDPVAFDDGEGVAALDGDKTEDPSVAVGEGDAPSEEIEDIPDFEFVRFVDPQDPTRTIVIASGQLSQSQGEADLVEVVDPEDSRRTIVIAKSSLSGEADAPPEAERGVVIRVPPAKEEPTEVTVRVPTRTPTPGPSQVAVPQPTAAAGGVVTVSGDATSVSFVTSGGGSYGTGDVPVGTYRIMAVFPGQQDAVQAGTFSVRDGQAVTVNCTAMMLRCSAR